MKAHQLIEHQSIGHTPAGHESGCELKVLDAMNYSWLWLIRKSLGHENRALDSMKN